MPDLTLIADVARTGAIGDGETIPWHYDADEQQYSASPTTRSSSVERPTRE